MSTATTRIDTGKVAGRRELHFNSLEDILADVDRLASSREIKTLGNWSAGQIFEHVGAGDGRVDRRVRQSSCRPILRFIFQYDDEAEDHLKKPMAAGFTAPQEGRRWS